MATAGNETVRLLLALLLGPWLLQELTLACLLAQPGWQDLLTDKDHWGTTYQTEDWKAIRYGGSGGEAYSLRAGQLEWDTCYDGRGQIILKIGDQRESTNRSPAIATTTFRNIPKSWWTATGSSRSAAKHTSAGQSSRTPPTHNLIADLCTPRTGRGRFTQPKGENTSHLCAPRKGDPTRFPPDTKTKKPPDCSNGFSRLDTVPPMPDTQNSFPQVLRRL